MEFKSKTVTVPRTLTECYQEDTVSKGLWFWCETIRKLGSTLFFLIIVCGLISSFKGSKIPKSTSYYEEVENEFSFGLFIAAMITWIIYAFAVYIVTEISILIISSLATIVQNTSITANVALYNASKTEEVKVNKTFGEEWFCGKCGTKNAKNQISCKNCGDYK